MTETNATNWKTNGIVWVWVGRRVGSHRRYACSPHRGRCHITDIGCRFTPHHRRPACRWYKFVFAIENTKDLFFSIRIRLHLQRGLRMHDARLQYVPRSHSDAISYISTIMMMIRIDWRTLTTQKKRSSVPVDALKTTDKIRDYNICIPLWSNGAWIWYCRTSFGRFTVNFKPPGIG